MRLFIDTNVYLSFIETSNESSKSLEELAKLLDKKKIKLIFPKITQEEFDRNFPGKTNQVANSFDKYLSKQPLFPAMLKDKTIKNQVKKSFDKYKKEIDNLKKAYLESAKKLKKIIYDLIEKSEKIDEPDGLVELAYQRRLKGNPPGEKTGPIGDEIEWEFLLNSCFDDRLTIITGDQGWVESTDEKKKLRYFLEREWGKRTKKKIEYYNSLGEFINAFTGKNKIRDQEIEQEKAAVLATSLDSRYLTIHPDSGVYTGIPVSSELIQESTVLPVETITGGNYCKNCKRSCLILGDDGLCFACRNWGGMPPEIS